jgi:hypothetical protein
MKKQPKRIVLTDEKVRDIEARLQINPRIVNTLSTGTRVIASIAVDELQKVSLNLFIYARHVWKQKGVNFSTRYKSR